MSLRIALPISAILIACTGGPSTGGGSLQGSTSERAPNSFEGAGTSQERGLRSNELASSTTERSGGGETTGSPTTSTAGFNCYGTYSCTVSAAGQTVTTKIPLAGCQTEQGGFQPDGTITKDGQVVATWTALPGGGFSYSGTSKSNDREINYTINCTKISDEIQTGDDDDDDDDDDDRPAPNPQPDPPDRAGSGER